MLSNENNSILLRFQDKHTSTRFIKGILMNNSTLYKEKERPLVVFLPPHLFISLASAPCVPNGSDDPGPSQCVVPQQPRPIGQVMAVRVGAGVRVGHGGDDGGLYHPLQVLAGRDCIDCGYEGTVRAGHVDPVLLKREESETGCMRKFPRIVGLASAAAVDQHVQLNSISVLVKTYKAFLTRTHHRHDHQQLLQIHTFSIFQAYSNDSIHIGKPLCM